MLPAVLLAAACKKAPAPAAPPVSLPMPSSPASPSAPSPTLRAALEALPAVPPCSAVVGSEWASGWPVPAEGGQTRYAVFFYPLGGDPESGPKLGAPAARALFDAKAGTVQSCEHMPARPDPAPGPRWPKAADGLDMKGFDARSDALYAATEKAAAAYAARDAAGPAAKDFWAAFDALAEPAFRDEYYRLNPAFWEWLRSAAGQSLLKPKG